MARHTDTAKIGLECKEIVRGQRRERKTRGIEDGRFTQTLPNRIVRFLREHFGRLRRFSGKSPGQYLAF